MKLGNYQSTYPPHKHTTCSSRYMTLQHLVCGYRVDLNAFEGWVATHFWGIWLPGLRGEISIFGSHLTEQGTTKAAWEIWLGCIFLGAQRLDLHLEGSWEPSIAREDVDQNTTYFWNQLIAGSWMMMVIFGGLHFSKKNWCWHAWGYA